MAFAATAQFGDPLSPAIFGAHRYLPHMKTKAGEVTALENLSAAARARILPLFHVCEEVKPSFAPSLGKAWLGYPAAIDGSFNFGHTGSGNVFAALVNQLRMSGVAAMPCWSVDDPLPYQYAARSLVDGLGAVIKVTLGQIPTLMARVQSLSLTPATIDLVIDLKHVGAQDVTSYGGYVLYQLSQNAGLLSAFRTVTLAAAAAPKDNGALSLGINRVARSDWQLWSTVRNGVPFRLDYGDYLTGHPDLNEPPGAAMAKATVSARYTLDNYWLIIKGRSTNGQYGLPMRQQYHSHAGLIANDPGFAGVANVWADAQIGQAAAGAQGMGSRAKWSGFAANRHISLVVDRLP